MAFVKGDVVELSPDSRWYGVGGANPVKMRGEVLKVLDGAPLPYLVEWENLTKNFYAVADLIRAGEEQEDVDDEKTFKKAVRQVVHSTGMCRFRIINTKGEVKNTENTACHAGLSYVERHPGDYGTPQYVVSLATKDHATFYKWLIEDSPWAPIFCRDYEWTAKTGCVATYCDVEANLIAGGLIVSRVPYEYEERAGHWLNLVQEGVNPLIALIMSHHCGRDGVFRPDMHSDGHWGLYGGSDVPLQYYRNLRMNKMINPIGPYNEVGKYEGVNALWGMYRDDYFAVERRHDFVVGGETVSSVWREVFGTETAEWGAVRNKTLNIKEMVKLCGIIEEKIR